TIRMDVDPALYDQFHVGQSIPVHCVRLANLFLFTRLAQQTTLSVIPWNIVQIGVVLIGAALIVWLWRKSRLYGILTLVAWLVRLALIVVLPMVPPRGEEHSASATVVKVNHFTQVVLSTRRSDHYDTPQPFDIVQFSFTPQGLSDPVVAVDAVDSGSVKN